MRGEQGLFEEALRELPWRSAGTTEGTARGEGKEASRLEGFPATVRAERRLEAECYGVECVLGPRNRLSTEDAEHRGC